MALLVGREQGCVLMQEAPHRHFLADTYPPPDHMLRDLSIDVITTGKNRARIQAPVVPHTCSENEFMYAGLLTTLVDVLNSVRLPDE